MLNAAYINLFGIILTKCKYVYRQVFCKGLECSETPVTKAAIAGPAYYVLHAQKGITICLFVTYQAFKNREGIISRKILAEWLKI